MADEAKLKQVLALLQKEKAELEARQAEVSRREARLAELQQAAESAQQLKGTLRDVVVQEKQRDEQQRRRIDELEAECQRLKKEVATLTEKSLAVAQAAKSAQSARAAGDAGQLRELAARHQAYVQEATTAQQRLEQAARLALQQYQDASGELQRMKAHYCKNDAEAEEARGRLRDLAVRFSAYKAEMEDRENSLRIELETVRTKSDQAVSALSTKDVLQLQKIQALQAELDDKQLLVHQLTERLASAEQQQHRQQQQQQPRVDDAQRRLLARAEAAEQRAAQLESEYHAREDNAAQKIRAYVRKVDLMEDNFRVQLADAQRRLADASKQVESVQLERDIARCRAEQQQQEQRNECAALQQQIDGLTARLHAAQQANSQAADQLRGVVARALAAEALLAERGVTPAPATVAVTSRSNDDEVHAQLQSVQNECAQLAADLDSARAKLRLLGEQHAAQLLAAQQQASAHAAAQQQAAERVQQLLDELAERDTANNALRQRIRSTDEQVQLLSERAQRAETQCTALTEQLQRAHDSQQHSAAKAAADELLQSLTASLAQQQAEAQQLHADLDDARQQIDALKRAAPADAAAAAAAVVAVAVEHRKERVMTDQQLAALREHWVGQVAQLQDEVQRLRVLSAANDSIKVSQLRDEIADLQRQLEAYHMKSLHSGAPVKTASGADLRAFLGRSSSGTDRVVVDVALQVGEQQFGERLAVAESMVRTAVQALLKNKQARKSMFMGFGRAKDSKSPSKPLQRQTSSPPPSPTTIAVAPAPATVVLRQVFERWPCEGSPPVPTFVHQLVAYLCRDGLTTPGLFNASNVHPKADSDVSGWLEQPGSFSLLKVVGSSLGAQLRAASCLLVFTRRLAEPLLSDLAFASLADIDARAPLAANVAHAAALLQRLAQPNKALLFHLTFLFGQLHRHGSASAEQLCANVLPLWTSTVTWAVADQPRVAAALALLCLQHDLVFHPPAKSLDVLTRCTAAVGALRPFVGQLFADDFALLSTVAAQPTNVPLLVRVLVSSGRFWQWFRLAVARTVDATDQATTLFRASTHVSAAVKYFLLNYCGAQRFIAALFADWLADMLLVDATPFVAADAKDLTVLAAQHRLLAHAVDRLAAAFEAVPPRQAPAYLRWAMTIVSNEASRRFATARLSSVSSWLFLRLAIPAILMPSADLRVSADLVEPHRSFVSAALKHMLRLLDGPSTLDDNDDESPRSEESRLAHRLQTWLNGLFVPNVDTSVFTVGSTDDDEGEPLVLDVEAAALLGRDVVDGRRLPDALLSALPGCLADVPAWNKALRLRLLGSWPSAAAATAQLLFDAVGQRVVYCEQGAVTLRSVSDLAVVKSVAVSCPAAVTHVARGASPDQVLLSTDAGLLVVDVASGGVTAVSPLPTLTSVLVDKQEIWSAAPSSIEIWDPFSFSAVASLHTDERTFSALCHVGEHIWAGSTAGDLAVYHVASRQRLHSYPGVFASPVHSLVACNGFVFAAARSAETIVFNAASQRAAWVMGTPVGDRVVRLVADPLVPAVWAVSASALWKISAQTFAFLDWIRLPVADSGQFDQCAVVACPQPPERRHIVWLASCHGHYAFSSAVDANHAAALYAEQDAQPEPGQLKRSLSNVSRKFLLKARPVSSMAASSSLSK